MTFILWPDGTGRDADFGGKARALAELQRSGLTVPAWFVLTPEAFYKSLSFSQEQAIGSGDTLGAAITLRGEIRLAEEAAGALAEALRRLAPDGGLVAVRSSAAEEDGADRSYAGQFDSFLSVPATVESVGDRAAAVWRSAFSQRVLAYREQAGLTAMPRPPAVLVQLMVMADRAGVAFGADPVAGRRGVAVIAAVWGLGSALVSGESDADTYHVDRTGAITLREIATKQTAHCPSPDSPNGVLPVAVPDSEATRAVLSDAQVQEVAALARRAGRLAGAPRDIEWAIEAGRLYLLQSRPITALACLPDPDGELNIWDNSNISESYNGVTTPLTFSFAQRAYTEVYRQMCRTLGVPEYAIAANDNTFRHMLGLIRGRVYYNLLNWYRLLVLLPGFAVNRHFMEQMMGVQEALPAEIADRLVEDARGADVWERLRMASTALTMAVNYIALPDRIRQFTADLDAALSDPDTPLDVMRPEELAAVYRNMERRLLTHWDPPLVNDLFAMIFYGLLGRLTEKWCGDADGSLRNTLVRGTGGMVSAEPAERVREMASLAAGDGELAGPLRTGDPAAVARAIDRRPDFRRLYRAYLDRFGDRCMEELKLESPTLADDPTPLHRAIGRLAVQGGANPQSSQNPRPDTQGGEQERGSPEHARSDGNPAPAQSKKPADRAALSGWRRIAFNWALKNARDRVRDRENLRFERTRLFGRVRRIFVQIGQRLSADHVLDAPRDVFYLAVDEILGFISGTSVFTDLRGVVAVRKREFEGYRAEPAPPSRFETCGAVAIGQPARPAGRPDTGEPGAGESRTLKGLGCCPGLVHGRICKVEDPRTAEIPPGSILAAARTDPGWVMLFPAAAGILVEHGSLLSHSAIVARELGIPSVVAIPGLMQTLVDGELVEMDGSRGIVRRLAERPAGGPTSRALSAAPGTGAPSLHASAEGEVAVQGRAPSPASGSEFVVHSEAPEVNRPITTQPGAAATPMPHVVTGNTETEAAQSAPGIDAQARAEALDAHADLAAPPFLAANVPPLFLRAAASPSMEPQAGPRSLPTETDPVDGAPEANEGGLLSGPVAMRTGPVSGFDAFARSTREAPPDPRTAAPTDAIDSSSSDSGRTEDSAVTGTPGRRR